MSDTIIKVEGVGKKYIIAHEASERHTSLRDVISAGAKKLVTKKEKVPASKEEFWALKDVNFEIKQGQAVGIIGRNGAGKSTLLKILSRITEPTHGRITIDGRIASLLEVGTGFHPELTGRENIFLNGAILGMSRPEIRSKFEEIVEFSGVEKFLDTPVKRYSSGMYVRLAFAVAAHLEPEILVVDEVLAVGDAEFQKKCLGKMNDVTKQAGRTVIFVSHNMAAISTLCTEAILMQQGRLIEQGETKKVIDTYIATGKSSTGVIEEEEISFSEKNPNLQLKKVTLQSHRGASNSFGLDEEVACVIEFNVVSEKTKVIPSIHLLNKYGDCILASFNSDSASVYKDPLFNVELGVGSYQTTCVLPAHLLNDTQYGLSVFLSPTLLFTELTAAPEVLTFEIHETGEMRQEYTGGWIGQIRPKLSWHTIQHT